MAPFTRGPCPICLNDTTQHVLRNKEDGLEMICASCQTVLLYRDDGSVGRRTAAERERAILPPPLLDERATFWREHAKQVRQGAVEVESWIGAGCPGLTDEMLSGMPGLAAVLAKSGVRPPSAGEHAPDKHESPSLAPGRDG